MERATTLIRRLGRLLRASREEAGLTQAQMAARCGLSGKHYGELERGDAEASVSALVCLARGVDMSLSELIDQITAAHRGIRPTLPLGDWVRASESFGKLKDYADQVISQAKASGAASDPTTYGRRARRSSAKRPRKRKRS